MFHSISQTAKPLPPRENELALPLPPVDSVIGLELPS